MLSWSDFQSSTRTVSTWFGARTVERDLPRNMREMGDLTELAYSYPHTSATQSSVQAEKKDFGAPCSLVLLPHSLCAPRLIEALQVPLPSEPD